jgi:creatinine amidohydrolase/Fe(II)-dependent formamide hydrolase-like protein
MTTSCLRSILAALLLTVGAATAHSQIHYVARMNTQQIRALDRDKTVIVLPGGILEQHGPYLPSFADGYRNEWTSQRLAEAIVAKPGWQVVIFPTVPLGVGGANEIGRKHVFPGTYAVRSTTLRAVFMDLATELGEQGFRWIFVVHAHGAPNHNRMLQQACDYFQDVYGGHMVHLTNLRLEPQDVPRRLTDAEENEDGFSVHAGAWETSWMLFLQPGLVSPHYRNAVPQTGHGWEDLVRLARAAEWPGYFGSPRLASAALAAQSIKDEETRIELALKLLDGLGKRTVPRVTDSVIKSEPNIAIDRDAIERERRIEAQQRDWLERHPIPNPELNP